MTTASGTEPMANKQRTKTTVDSAKFRAALSCFATGVAVVTCLDHDKNPVGITISSFNSVSLEPPLVLWSIAKNAKSYQAFTATQYFGVSVLAMHQEDISSRFARSGENKFSDLACRSGIGSVPILPEYAACFECSTEHCYDGGDHTIIVGRVLSLEDRESNPLIFYRGRYLRKGGPYPNDTPTDR